MSSDIIVKARAVGKRYRIGQRQRYKALRDSIADAAKIPLRYVRAFAFGPSHERASGETDFWALRDVSFEISRGEAVGVIGRNGAGKSTLLKVLSRITEPTTGRIEIQGRVGSLLEVGTGFHPELTGRENIFLNGAILGMKRAEIRARFDEITAFAEVETFLDTPVKHYSSGMYTRLAFAVAAHLDPEILVVDEVLAVGDAQFQRKCLGKMGEVANQGRTVIFVSHNMAAVAELCKRALLLDHGELRASGPTAEIISQYLQTGAAGSDSGDIPLDRPRAFGTGEARIRRVRVVALDGSPAVAIGYHQPFRVEVTLEALRPIADLVVEVGLMDPYGVQVSLSLSSDYPAGAMPAVGAALLTAVFEADNRLIPRTYSILAGLHHKHGGNTIDWVERCCQLEVETVGADAADVYALTSPRGYVNLGGTWSFTETVDPP